MIDLITPTHEIAVKMGYKQLAELLKISRPAACKKLKSKNYSVKDVECIIGSRKRLMLLDRQE